MEYSSKCEKLKSAMNQYAQEDVMIAFSGGVDSSLLLKLATEAAKETDRKVYAATLHTMLHPITELFEARATAEEMGAEHIVLQVDELSEANITMNPKDRCYRCKKCLFQKVLQKAAELSVATVIEGTNEDDLHVYRPGIKAVKELGIESPLAQVKMTKKDVRKLAAEYNVSSSNKPSTPCLATRFPYGTELTYEKMQKVEAGETFLKQFGFYNVRARVHDELVRIEVDTNQIQMLFEYRDEIIKYMKQLGYGYVTLDLEGFRSGSYDQ